MNKQNLRPSSSRLHKNNLSLTPKHAENASLTHQGKQTTSRKDYQQECIRLIIANNVEYFQNKLRTTPNNRAKDLRLKLPCHTGITTYRKEYNEKEVKYNLEKRAKHSHSTEAIKISNFLKEESSDIINNKTNYQNEFKKHSVVRSESSRRCKKKKEPIYEDDGVPRFLETQSKTDYLNWGGKNYVPSMKPQEKPAVTNLPFEGNTVYRSQFDGKCIPPTPIFTRQSSFPKFGLVAATMKSNYSSEFFMKKSHGMEISCKPKHSDATLCKQFKGSTEYKRSFNGICQQRTQQDQKYKTLCELQTLIIDL